MLMKIVKAVAAAAVGLVLLDLFCAWYYNPASYEWDEARATDVIREPGAFTSRANEGFSSTIIDENGYVNSQVPGEDGVFVLMMGSSHVEGLYVPQGDGVTAQLQSRLQESGLDGFVYNIGISGHELPRNVNNLDRALTRFAPSGYVVLETRTVVHNANLLFGVLDGKLHRNGSTKVVFSKLISDRPLVRTIYRQLLNLRSAEAAENDAGEEVNAEELEVSQELLDLYMETLSRLMRLVREVTDAHGVTPIIYYHPTLQLQEDGSVTTDTFQPALDIYKAACAQERIAFLDMTDAFLEAYETEHILPHGFINTRPGTGHLNADGNRIIAEALCAEILKGEADK